MKISTSKVFASALVAIMFSMFSTSNISAAEQANPFKIGPAEISFNAGYMSNYQWRGEDQNSGDGTAMGGIDVALPYNIYAGTWTASAEWANGQEIDFYAGIAPSFGDISFDLGYISYYYQGGNDATNFGEFYVGATYAPEKAPYSFGVKYSDNDTDGGFATDGTKIQSDNIEFTASYDILSIAYGEFKNYTDYTTVALAKEFGGIEFSLAYTTTDWDASQGNGTNGKDEFLIVSLSKSF